LQHLDGFMLSDLIGDPDRFRSVWNPARNAP